jgi:hypothetical protein
MDEKEWAKVFETWGLSLKDGGGNEIVETNASCS